MKIITADPTGLCFGVKRAITTLENELKKTHQAYALGSPIHNPQETERLEKLGLIVVDSPKEVPEGAVSFVRAHGGSSSSIRRKRCRRARYLLCGRTG